MPYKKDLQLVNTMVNKIQQDLASEVYLNKKLVIKQ